MANYYGTERTNYFRVKDEQKFREWAESLSAEVIRDKEGRFGLIPGPYSDDGTFPSVRFKDEDELEEGEDNMEEIDFMGELAEHLEPGSIAVSMQAGAKKYRYIVGFAEAIDHTGKVVSVSLQDIYQKAANAFGVPFNDITEAQY